MKIFLTGGSGVLGKELVKYCENQGWDIYAPSHQEMDIELDNEFHKEYYLRYLPDNCPDYFIHTAALVDTLECEKWPEKALMVNVEPIHNIVRHLVRYPQTKFIYISTEYIFDGRHGDYYPTDRLNPINVYGKTKAAAEQIVSILPNYQIVRAPFIKKIHPQAWTDQYCSRYFVEELPEKIMNNAMYNTAKIVHISPNKVKSVYEHYIDKGLQVTPTTIPYEYNDIIPRHINLINTSKW